MTGEWDKERIGEVLAQIRRAIALQPDLPIAYHALAQAQSRAGNLDAALAAASGAASSARTTPACFYTLGAAQLQLGQSEPALRNLEQAMNRNPVPPAYLPAFYATALWANRRFEEAIRVADDCLARAPDFWRCRQDRIAALVELGRLPEARAGSDPAQGQGAADHERGVRVDFRRRGCGLARASCRGRSGGRYSGRGHGFALKASMIIGGVNANRPCVTKCQLQG